jgi:Fur family ferric uptake transcriptional regulator
VPCAETGTTRPRTTCTGTARAAGTRCWRTETTSTTSTTAIGTRRTAPTTTSTASKQRAAVSAALDEIDDVRTAQELHAALRERGEGIGLTTVYRALQALADAGQVDVLRTTEGEASYRRCSSGHHHHLVCRGCGRTVEVEGPAVERWADKVAAEHGYADISHTLEIFGTCQDCQRP